MEADLKMGFLLLLRSRGFCRGAGAALVKQSPGKAMLDDRYYCMCVVAVGALTEINVSNREHSPSAQPNMVIVRRERHNSADLQKDTMPTGMRSKLLLRMPKRILPLDQIWVD